MTFKKIPSVEEKLFGRENKLLPSVSEMFELEFANLEYKSLGKKSFLERTAFFQSSDGKYSKHFLMYAEENKTLYEGRSAATQNYFENGQLSTGSATEKAIKILYRFSTINKFYQKYFCFSC